MVVDQGDAAAAEGVRLALEHAETLELGANISSSLVRVTPTTSPAALVGQGGHMIINMMHCEYWLSEVLIILESCYYNFLLEYNIQRKPLRLPKSINVKIVEP